MKRLILVASFILTIIIFWGQRSVFAEGKRQRIISLAPAITEILFSLGLDDEIVGVTTFCDYPPKAQNKEKVGSFSQPNIEKIIFLKPDIIFATGLEQAYVVGKLKQVGLNIFISDPATIDELFASINKIGELTEKVNEAKSLIDGMKTRIKKVKDKVRLIPENKRPKVFIEIWDSPLMTAGKGSFVDELITIAGGINIAYDVPRPYSSFNSEQLIKRNPGYIILAYMDKIEAKETVKERLGFSELNAVKNNHVYDDINPDLYLRPGPRLVEGLEEIYKKLYSQ